MSRLDHTPHYDAWREKLRAATDGRGIKLSLARHMAALTGQSVHNWQCNVGRILRKETVINAEDLLAIDAWIHSLPPRTATPKAQKSLKPTTPHHGRPPATPRQA